VLSNRLFKSCVCSYTNQEFQKKGKCKCSNCFSQFFETHRVAYKFSIPRFPELPPRYQSLDISYIQKEWESLRFSYRFRFARNVKGFLLGIHAKQNPKLQITLQNLFCDIGISDFHSGNKFFYKNYYYYFFDEDHIRWEIFPKEILQLEEPWIPWESHKRYFQFKNQLGYINSCPTNLGRGNKFSIQAEILPKKNLALFKQILNLPIGKLEQAGIDVHKQQKINFFIKNYNSFRLQKFIQTVFYCLDEL
jgi:hypothetical protein